jgi:hypothetical protein
VAEENLSVRTYLEEVTPEKRRRDAQTLLELMTPVMGEKSAIVEQRDRPRPVRSVQSEQPEQDPARARPTGDFKGNDQ